MLCSHPASTSWMFIPSPTETQSVNPASPCPAPALAPTILLSDSMTLTPLGASYKWDPAILVSERRAPFARHSVPAGGVLQQLSGFPFLL